MNLSFQWGIAFFIWNLHCLLKCYSNGLGRATLLSKLSLNFFSGFGLSSGSKTFEKKSWSKPNLCLGRLDPNPIGLLNYLFGLKIKLIQIQLKLNLSIFHTIALCFLIKYCSFVLAIILWLETHLLEKPINNTIAE